MRLTKSDYLRYLKCPRYAWVHKHNPTRIRHEKTLSGDHAQNERDQLQRLARRLFPGGQSVRSDNLDEAHRHTQELIASGAPAIFSATIVTPDLSATTDVLHKTDAGWDIISIQSAGSVHQKHLSDLAFQKHVWRQADLVISRLQIGHINKAYVRGSHLNPKELITITDVTATVPEIDQDVASIRDYVLATSEPTTTCAHPRSCPMPDICWSDLPTYSIYDIPRLTADKINQLRSRQIINVRDVPDDAQLSPKQRLQVQLAQANRVLIDHERLASALNQLNYPLYFLDYEAFGPAIPELPGYQPYQHLVFQYSLHVIAHPEAEFEHKSFLSRDFATATEQVAASLRQNIGPQGHIVVWHKTFETQRHIEMGRLYPKHAEFMTQLNDRIFDLRDVFEHQLYIDPRFRGGTSIKNILPILAPELSYKQLPIREGTEAAAQWYLMVRGNLPLDKQERIYTNLARYCYLDTLAMVKIFENLTKLAPTTA